MTSSNNIAKKEESFFLDERFMAVTCIIVLVTGLVSLYFCVREGETFELFELLTKLVMAAAMYLAFRFFKWDVVKGLMGGVLFCLMFQEAYLVFAKLWGEQDFDAYNKDSFAAFTFAEGQFSFAFDNPSEAIREAASRGGSGFMQFGLIRDGEIVMTINRPRARCYRTLAELNGNLCVIDSVNMLHFDEFLEELLRWGSPTPCIWTWARAGIIHGTGARRKRS